MVRCGREPNLPSQWVVWRTSKVSARSHSAAAGWFGGMRLQPERIGLKVGARFGRRKMPEKLGCNASKN